MSFEPVRVAICASGAGTNAEAIIRYERSAERCAYRVVLIVSTRETAGVVQVAQRYGVQSCILHARADDPVANETELLKYLAEYAVDVVCLAGFMRKVPDRVIDAFESRILNVHPALLPQFGGKGMYGERVFQAVLEAGSDKSGATIHLVNRQYDEGRILAQTSFQLDYGESIESLAEKTRKIEHELYPKILEKHVLESFVSH